MQVYTSWNYYIKLNKNNYYLLLRRKRWAYNKNSYFLIALLCSNTRATILSNAYFILSLEYSITMCMLIIITWMSNFKKLLELKLNDGQTLLENYNKIALWKLKNSAEGCARLLINRFI